MGGSNDSISISPRDSRLHKNRKTLEKNALSNPRGHQVQRDGGPAALPEECFQYCFGRWKERGTLRAEARRNYTEGDQDDENTRRRFYFSGIMVGYFSDRPCIYIGNVSRLLFHCDEQRRAPAWYYFVDLRCMALALSAERAMFAHGSTSGCT